MDPYPANASPDVCSPLGCSFPLFTIIIHVFFLWIHQFTFWTKQNVLKLFQTEKLEAANVCLFLNNFKYLLFIHIT